MNNTETCDTQITRSGRQHRTLPVKYGQNEVKLVGVLGEARYQHSHMGVNYYEVKMELIKPDGKENHVPIQLTQEQIYELLKETQEESVATKEGSRGTDHPIFKNEDGKWFDFDLPVEVVGTLRAVKQREATHTKKITFVKVRKVNLVFNWEYVNDVILEGEVIKTFNPRTTEKGREVQDFLLNVRRHPDRDCYIYIVTIGEMAKVAKELKPGDNLMLKGAFVNRSWEHKMSGEAMESNEVFAFELTKS